MKIISIEKSLPFFPVMEKIVKLITIEIPLPFFPVIVKMEAWFFSTGIVQTIFFVKIITTIEKIITDHYS